MERRTHLYCWNTVGMPGGVPWSVMVGYYQVSAWSLALTLKVRARSVCAVAAVEGEQTD